MDVKGMPIKAKTQIVQLNKEFKASEIPIYIIALSNESKRKERLKKRLEYHNLTKRATFVDAVYKSDKVIAEIKKDYTNCSDAEAACMLSHLKAINTFITESKAPHCIILESDAVFHNKFNKKLEEVYSKIADIPLLMLNAYISAFEGIFKADNGFMTIGPMTYSTLGYIINREYANTLLSMFTIKDVLKSSTDSLRKNPVYKPFKDYKPNQCIKVNSKEDYSESNKRVTSEIITIKSGGYFVEDILLIDESIDTQIQHQQSNQWHLDYYTRIGHHNFADADFYCENLELLQYWGLV